jgi:SAM-dependent methyltransferase
MNTAPRTTLVPRPKEQPFFTRYWCPSGSAWKIYRYQWFLRPCREIAFAGLARAPLGIVVEFGSGRGSAAEGEPNPTHVALDIVAFRAPDARRVAGDAQILPFRDQSLSGIWGQTALMHLSPELVAAEAHRVLRPGGVLAVVEPLRGHPLIGLARNFLPGRRVRPEFMRFRELQALGSRFRRAQVVPFFLVSPVTLLTARRSVPVVRALQALDALLLRRLPALHPMAWYAAAWFQK